MSRFLRCAPLVLLAAVVIPLFTGPLGSDCESCCPKPRDGRASLSAASCCGDDCGSTLVKGQRESCALVNRSVTTPGPGSGAAAIVTSLASVFPAAFGRARVACSLSPPRIATALRL
jgi:hypothetical protein